MIEIDRNTVKYINQNTNQNIKIVFFVILPLFLFLALCTSTCFAGEISQKNIDDGLRFCAEYPVSLTYEGEKIAFAEKDTPPVIITPNGEENGRTLIPCRALFEKMGGEVTWDNESETVGIKLDDTRIELVIGKSCALVNGKEQELEVPALIIDHDGDYYGSTMIPVRFVVNALGSDIAWDDNTRTVMVFRPKLASDDISDMDNPNENTDLDNQNNELTGGGASSGDLNYYGDDTLYLTSDDSIFPYYEMGELPLANENVKNKLIVLDFGHGGTDSGAIGHEGQSDQLYEKDLNLAIGLKLAEHLKNAGMNIYLIRDKDKSLTKYERAAIANEQDADFFISVHNNSSEYSNPKGTEVLYYAKVNENGEGESVCYGINSSFVAQYIQKEMVKALGTQDRGIQNKPSLAVLNKTKMPAIIIEGAFISNPDDFKKMKTKQFVERYAYAAAKAIIEAFNVKF